jgi:hypothetical protein
MHRRVPRAAVLSIAEARAEAGADLRGRQEVRLVWRGVRNIHDCLRW